MKKIAIIGASYLQNPLIEKAKQMGIETHVFAWETGDIGEKNADFFYPISITEKEEILKICQEIKIDGICTIASDLAVITVNYIADKMKLIGNSLESTKKSTNKYFMRKAFYDNGDPSPKSILLENNKDVENIVINYPAIIKPIDRSGSRGITKVSSKEELMKAYEKAKEVSFSNSVLVEEYVDGEEYSVECISDNGYHQCLAITKKFTTGVPHFIEKGHLEPANISKNLYERVKNTVFHALDSLEIKYGASHSEVKITKDEIIKIIEIGGRMGGDYIGSHLVEISTGIDFLESVILIALGEKPNLTPRHSKAVAAIRFIFSEEDVKTYNEILKENPKILIEESISPINDREVTDSSTRFGYFLMKGNNLNEISPYLNFDNDI